METKDKDKLSYTELIKAFQTYKVSITITIKNTLMA